MDVLRSLYKKGLYWGMVFLLLSFSCGNPQTGEGESGGGASTKETRSNVMESDAAKHILRYWDDFTFKRVALADNRDQAEQKLVDFIALFPTVEDTVSQVAVANMLQKASADSTVLDYFLAQYKHYLYDPNSPMRNEDYYGKVLSFLVQAEGISDDDKVKYATLLELVQKNQVGTKATDFSFLTEDGQHQFMYAGTKPYKMLVFYDPTCTQCAAMMQDLAQTPAVHNCIENGFLDIVSISLHPDKQSWLRYQERIPANWINGWDENETVINDGLYNITAYPTIFLLDKENTVLLKDAPLRVTLRYLVDLVLRDS